MALDPARFWQHHNTEQAVGEPWSLHRLGQALLAKTAQASARDGQGALRRGPARLRARAANKRPANASGTMAPEEGSGICRVDSE
jgi:hypothetical protein